MIIGITGTIGAGKGEVAAYFTHNGFHHISVSGFLAKELVHRQLPGTRVGRRNIGNEYRKKSPTALLEAVLGDHNPEKENIVIESLHTVPEVTFIQHLGGKVISVDAPLETRWERIHQRMGVKDNVSHDEFVAEQEIQMASNNPNENNVRAAMEISDYRLENAGTPQELLQKLVDLHFF
jgi:dephospho-CoA kinase